jgi:hypothetical protein
MILCQPFEFFIFCCARFSVVVHFYDGTFVVRCSGYRDTPIVDSLVDLLPKFR